MNVFDFSAVEKPRTHSGFIRKKLYVLECTNFLKNIFSPHIFQSTFQLSYEQKKILKLFLRKCFVESKKKLVQLII